MENKPYTITVFISPFIGELLHSGESIPRILNNDEMTILDLQNKLTISKNYPSYADALLALKEIIGKIHE